MPAKRKREPESRRKEKEHSLPKPAKDHVCLKCEKSYSSPQALYTHINTKHPYEKQSCRRNSIHPARVILVEENCLRMDDILYDKQAEGLMTLADTTFKNIVEHLEGKASNFLIEVGEGLSDYDQQIDELIRDIKNGEPLFPQTKPMRVSNRSQHISQLKQQLRQQYRIPESTAPSKALSTFKISYFEVSLVGQLSKLFKEPFAAKIQLSLEIIDNLKQVPHQSSTADQLSLGLEDIWNQVGCRDIKDILIDYYNQWNTISPSWEHPKRQNTQIKQELC